MEFLRTLWAFARRSEQTAVLEEHGFRDPEIQPFDDLKVRTELTWLMIGDNPIAVALRKYLIEYDEIETSIASNAFLIPLGAFSKVQEAYNEEFGFGVLKRFFISLGTKFFQVVLSEDGDIICTASTENGFGEEVISLLNQIAAFELELGIDPKRLSRLNIDRIYADNREGMIVIITESRLALVLSQNKVSESRIIRQSIALSVMISIPTHYLATAKKVAQSIAAIHAEESS